MNGKKRIVYIIAAVALIAAGIYLERSSEDGEGLAAVESSSAFESVEKVQNAGDTETTDESELTAENLPEDYVAYYFRNDDLLEQHYEKHGMEMGFESMEAYEEAACAVIYHPDVLSKTEEEDGDYIYYVEESNEFVVVSGDGYIRTYFNPRAGIEYYNRQ